MASCGAGDFRKRATCKYRVVVPAQHGFTPTVSPVFVTASMRTVSARSGRHEPPISRVADIPGRVVRAADYDNAPFTMQFCWDRPPTA